jgi:hypothetical protein
MKSNLMVPTTFKYRQGPLMAPYMSSMSHINDVVINLGGESVSSFKESYLNDDESGVGGLNYMYSTLGKTIGDSNHVPYL